MSIYSIWKDIQPNQNEKEKMVKMIKNKLAPLNQNKRYPMGKSKFLDFKNLQKVPKLKKEHFDLSQRKSQTQENIMNDLMTKQLNKTQQTNFHQIYQRPSNWLKLWKKTGDTFKNQYFTARGCDQNKLIFPQQTLYPADFRTKMRYRSSEHTNLTNLTRMTKSVLKKVQIFKNIKSKQNQQKKKIKLKKVKSRNHHHTESSVFLTLNEKQNDVDAVQQDQVTQLKPEIKRNDEWISFIAKFIFQRHTQKSDEDKFYQQFTARKHQNGLKDFIGLFERNNKGLRSCHIQRTTYNLDKSCEQQRRIKQVFPQIMSIVNNEQDKQNDVVTCNNPVVKLRRLQSMCKIVDSNMAQNEDKRNVPSYTCSKIRINSNHKKIIATNR